MNAFRGLLYGIAFSIILCACLTVGVIGACMALFL